MPNVLHTPDSIFSPRHASSWLLLAGASGAVNGLAFLVCEKFVTHVTGAATQFGIEWPGGVAIEFAAVVLSFVAGAMASVVAIQRRVAQGKKPQWAVPLVVVAMLLIGIAVAGSAGFAGAFGNAEDTPSFVFLILLAFANGLQNATVATATGQAVRTTHLTGPATDFGVYLGVACLGKREDRASAMKGAMLRGSKVIVFIIGAGLSIPLGLFAGYGAFLFPAAAVLLAAALSFVPAWGTASYPT